MSILRSVSLIVVVICISASTRAQQSAIGFVLDLRGDWVADGEPLQKGQAVQAASRIALASKSASPKVGESCITITLLDSHVVGCPCGVGKSCGEPFALPASLTKIAPLRERIIEAAMRLFARQPDRFVPALSRGVSQDVSLQDGVAKLNGRQVTFGSLLDCKAGSYIIEFQSLIPGHGSTEESSVVESPFECRGPNSLAVSPKRLAAGLYEVSLLSRTSPKSDVISAWLLLASSETYAESVDSFSQAKALTGEWDGTVAEDAVTTFLRAYLYSLATSSGT